MRYVEHHLPSTLAQVGQIDAIPVKRCDQKLIRHLSMDEVRAILNAPDLSTRSGVRDRAMLTTSASPAACASRSWSASCWKTLRSTERPA